MPRNPRKTAICSEESPKIGVNGSIGDQWTLLSYWCGLVDDVRTYFLENRSVPSFKQIRESVMEKDSSTPEKLRAIKQFEHEQVKEQRAVRRLHQVFQRRVQSPGLPVPRKKGADSSVTSPNGPTCASSNQSPLPTAGESGGVSFGRGTLGGEERAPSHKAV
jgi:hypothetical protein